MRIPPGKITELLIKFKPVESRDHFEAHIFFEVQNYREPILSLIGSAVDISFKLNKDVINFGNVVIGYSNEETIKLTNNGFIGATFRWQLEKKSSYVSFVGGEGYSPPNSEVTTNIIFKPGHVQCVFKFKAYCDIDNYKRLELLLIGGAMNVPPPLNTIYFTSPVREQTFSEIEFNNETKEIWNTRPVFTGTFFSGAEVLSVPKESTILYKIIYAPTKMSSTPHKGTVFFPLPSGFSRLYALEGIVSNPKPIGEITREIRCKTYHTETLLVENWLGLRQQLKIITEVLEGDSNKIIYKITSNDVLELPPYGKRSFKWTIYVINEGKLTLKVTFMNEKTKEYIFYIITLKILPSEESIETIKFSTCVRVPITRTIVIRNPLMNY
ncbi:hypothetical protein HHI36_005596 [Cryptolaemus montrouzieri]|uniref:Uncharacterized protein n=1 Tax=Cryptolaemus montrouzieri TaxID=559131 RepID=A0ABD2NUK5_9CUCU